MKILISKSSSNLTKSPAQKSILFYFSCKLTIGTLEGHYLGWWLSPSKIYLLPVLSSKMVAAAAIIELEVNIYPVSIRNWEFRETFKVRLQQLQGFCKLIAINYKFDRIHVNWIQSRCFVRMKLFSSY